MSIAMILEIVLAGLLIAAIAVMGLLHRRLDQLRAGRTEFERLTAELAAAAAAADASIGALRRAVESSDELLTPRLARAEALKDEIAFLTERAEKQAHRLDSAIRVGRSGAGAEAPNAAMAQLREAVKSSARDLPAALAALR